MLKTSALKNLLIVDNDRILLNFLDRYLTVNDYSTTCASKGDEIPALLEKTRYDLIILDDIKPSNRSNFYWLKWIKQYYSYIPVIVMSPRVNEDYRLEGLLSGAKDYLIKPFREGELLIRIQNTLRPNKPVSLRHTVLSIGNLMIDMDKCSVIKDEESIKLTTLEANILKLLYLNAGAVLSRDEITEQVRGGQHRALDRSIDIHINRLRNKIENDPTSPKLIRTTRGKGYSFHLPEMSPSIV